MATQTEIPFASYEAKHATEQKDNQNQFGIGNNGTKVSNSANHWFDFRTLGVRYVLYDSGSIFFPEMTGFLLKTAPAGLITRDEAQYFSQTTTSTDGHGGHLTQKFLLNCRIMHLSFSPKQKVTLRSKSDEDFLTFCTLGFFWLCGAGEGKSVTSELVLADFLTTLEDPERGQKRASTS